MPSDPLMWGHYIYHKYRSKPQELNAWLSVLRTVNEYFKVGSTDFTLGATFYTTTGIYEKFQGTDHWTQGLVIIGVVGDHIFYKSNREDRHDVHVF
jgi:hypothetical protein